MTDPSYPREWEADVLASDGGTVHLRPIGPADADGLVAFHGRLSERTRYLRFFGPYPRIPDRDLRRFTEVDHRDRVAFVAELTGDLIAVARYERTAGTDAAEVAFVVEDRHQGRGLGSVLLEHLAAAARERGIGTFVADVLSENSRMIRVFLDAGYTAARSYVDGVVRLSFPTRQTEASIAVVYEREQRAEARSVERLLAPASVAVLGASRDPAKVGHVALANLRDYGFAGPIHPVNPATDEIDGLPTYPDIGSVPGPVDLAVVAVPTARVPAVVAQCADRGVRGLVVHTGGFADRDEAGAAAERALVAAAHAGGMRVVGPNCLGVVNTDPAVRLNASLAPVPVARGRIGFFCQSGALGIATVRAATDRGLGLSTFVSAGNRADVSGNDLMQFWAGDPATEVVLMWLESFGNPRKFARLSRGLARRKPVVLLKTGPWGRFGLAGGAAVDRLFTESGLIRVDSTAQMFDVAALLTFQPLPRGPRVAIVGNSGALGLLAADACVGAGLQVAAGYPVDLGTAPTAAEFATTLAAAAAGPGVDAVVALFVPPVAVPGEPYARAIADVADRAAAAGTPVLSTFLAEAGVPQLLRRYGPDGAPCRGSVPSYPSPELGVQALARVTEYAQWRRRAVGREPELPDTDRAAAVAVVRSVLDREPGGRRLTDEEAAALLGAYGIRPRPSTPDAAGVVTVVEVADNAAFGAVVSFGVGGVATDLLGDRAVAPVPLTDADAARLVRAPRAAPLLSGYGGTEPVDLAAVEELILRVTRLADDVPEVLRVELNPVLVARSGATVRAAAVTVGMATARTEPGPRRLR